jgi:hypothetical protein
MEGDTPVVREAPERVERFSRKILEALPQKMTLHLLLQTIFGFIDELPEDMRVRVYAE